MLTEEYNIFKEDLDPKKLDSKILLNACMNIFIFIRNNNEFKVKSEIGDILNTIFYIYLEKYFVDYKKENKQNDEEE